MSRVRRVLDVSKMLSKSKGSTWLNIYALHTAVGKEPGYEDKKFLYATSKLMSMGNSSKFSRGLLGAGTLVGRLLPTCRVLPFKEIKPLPPIMRRVCRPRCDEYRRKRQRGGGGPIQSCVVISATDSLSTCDWLT